ncbi:MAG: T9SS type A sorting domain-containing protein [Flavobacteriales bacterium]|nr:T9SS type A sorting domain-containing protein [Flavobacteriales bacterium]
MKRFEGLILLSLILFGSEVSAQIPTFSDDVAPILWDKCVKCHHDDGIANSTLINYSEVLLWTAEIKLRINSTDAQDKMPPWSPDTNYRHFIGERILTASEINDITTWIDNGTPSGDTSLLPSPPTFTNGSSIGVPDLVLKIPDYVSQAVIGQDDFVCFTLPTGLTSSKMIQAIEIIPGNYGIVHHVSVMKDISGFATDTTSHTCMGYGNFMTGYLPGSRPVIYPNGPGLKLGMPLMPNENIVVNIHYHEGSFGTLDSTKINLFFYDDTVSNIREVKFSGAINGSSFCFDANTLDTLEATFPSLSGMTSSISMINVVGHCHWLGKEFLVYMIDSLNDTIPLLHIPQWNFEWQDFYSFEYLQKFPVGARIYARAIYDNAIANTNNPNSPPQMVCEGQSSTDEMFSVYFHYIDYMPGDENINLDSIFQLITYAPPEIIPTSNLFQVYPNPFNNQVTIQYALANESQVAVNIYNAQGELVKTLLQSNQAAGVQMLSWNGRQEGGGQLPNGLYLVSLNINGDVSMQKVILGQ